MSNVHSDTLRSFRRKPVRTSIEVGAVKNAAGVDLGLRDEQAFELPAQLFEQLPFAVYLCDRDGLVRRYNRRAAELWGRSPKLGDPDERFCGSYRMFRPDGRLLQHAPAAWRCFAGDPPRLVAGEQVRGPHASRARPRNRRRQALGRYDRER
jgi:PAS domain-containing protein